MRRFCIQSSERVGELFAAASIFLWALFPFLVNQEVNPLSPLWSAALSTLFAIPPLLVLCALRGSWRQLAIRAAWRPMIYLSLLIGVVFYGLLFLGTYTTSPINMSLLALLEVPLAFLLLRPIKSERVRAAQTIGAALMLFGAAILLSPWNVSLNIGDILIVIACFAPPFGNYFAKQARLLVSSEVIMLVRSAIGGINTADNSASFADHF